MVVRTVRMMGQVAGPGPEPLGPKQRERLPHKELHPLQLQRQEGQEDHT